MNEQIPIKRKDEEALDYFMNDVQQGYGDVTVETDAAGNVISAPLQKAIDLEFLPEEM